MLVAGCSLVLATAHAQTPLSNLVYTAGTTIRDISNQDWTYVLLDTSDPQVIAGKRFVVYGKTGYPTNAGSFTLRGNLVQAPDVATINTRLNQSVALGQNLGSLNDALAMQVGTNVMGLLRKVPGITGQSLPQKVLTAFQLAATDPALAEMISLLAKGNPGLNLCAGRAFSEVIGSVTTYEVRELNPATGAAGDLVGRVTLVPNAPVVLPAPGKPFQVVSNQPSEHLQIRVRWGTPPELRRLSVLNVGFNLWRIPRLVAEAANYHNLPPSTAQLLSNTNFVRANRAPVYTAMDYSIGSGAGAADDPADRTTFFFSDSSRGSGLPPFNDGQQFYYFVTARDLLGRDGLVSAGGLASACRRSPPPPPTGVRVENAVVPSSTNTARLQVFWKQNTNAADLVTQYWIYRWPNPTMALTNEATPLNNLAGTVAQLPGTNFNSFIDNSPGALTNAGLSNIWYTVRAVSQAACDNLFSPPSAPAWGVLRDRTAPDAATGTVVGSCGTPVVMFQAFATNSVNTDTNSWHLRLTCVRRDSGIAWVQYSLTNTDGTVDNIGPIYFPPDGDTATLDLNPTAFAPAQPGQIGVSCVVGTIYDQVAQPRSCVFNVPFPFTQQREAVFFAGQLLATALSYSDPLLSVLNNGNFVCSPGYYVTPDASGMVSMQFSLAPGTPALIQALTNNTWIDIAVVTPDTNGFYWVSYPACLVGPLPTFQGCAVNLPSDAGCDQHVAYAADGGAVAPLKVRFKLTKRTREYRVYRRAGDGPLTFLAQGAAVYDPSNPNKIIETKDEGMPSVPVRLCYFVQLLDENGNGSPLSFIGCKESKPPKIPKPVLSEPKPTGTLGSPQVILTWFCPTAGISRFQVKIKRLDPPTTNSQSGFASAAVKKFSGYNAQATYLGVTKESHSLLGILAALSFDEAHFTSPIGVGFGPGPQFTLTGSVLANVKYLISVTPVDDQGRVIETSTSEAVPFVWTAPVEPVTVPWPARSMPPVRTFEVVGSVPSLPGVPVLGVAAVLLVDANFQQDQRYPVGIRIGLMDRDSDHMGLQQNIRSSAYASYNVYQSQANPDPNTYVHRRKGSGESLLPIVVYRQQVTNALFPKVSGDVLQVSPLIERVPWAIIPFSVDYTTVAIPDRLFAIGTEFTAQATFYPLYLRDQQPVQQGAKYRYLVVRFNAKREIQEIIPAGDLQIPQLP